MGWSPCVNGSPATTPVDITLQKANVTGTVYESNGTTPAANTQVSAGSSGGCCQNTSTNSSGTYGFALGNGTWNITANPPMGDSTDAPTSVSVTVAGGVVTMVNGSPAAGTGQHHLAGGRVQPHRHGLRVRRHHPGGQRAGLGG